MFNYDVKFLTCGEILHLKNVDFKSSKYETRKRSEESVYDTSKRSYCERRGGYWRAPKPRQIRQLESKLRERNIISCEWSYESIITIVFSSGAIAYLTIKPSTLDVTQILFDRYCVGKMSSQTVMGVVLSNSHLMFTHAERMVTLVTFGKTAVNNVPCRISDRDPHIQTIELSGGPRRTDRRVSWCECASGLEVLMWSTATAEPAPWSPVIEDRANLHLYQIEGQQMSLKAFHQLENETLSAELSQRQRNIVHIVEQISCHKTGVNLEWARYDVAGVSERATKLSSLRMSETRVTLPAPARTSRRSPCDQRLLLSCIDGSLHIVHNCVGLTHSTKASFIATDVRWAGELIVAAEEGGRLQCFDRALSSLHHHTKCIDLASYLREPRRMQVLATRNATGGPFILATFNSGPLTLMRITHTRLLTAWLQTGRSSNAVALLRAMDWEEDGTECLWAVNKLVCNALRSGTAAVAEEGSAQAALGAYLAPLAPLPQSAMRYAPPVHDLARKFFHHLLRRSRAEKALSLAVDLQAWDLCCDVRWAARRCGDRALAHEADSLAAHYATTHKSGSDCADSCSQCSSHSYSGSEAETNTSSDIVKTEPPPLPRVSLPSTVMPVSITQAEPASTNSIRPNLHQYLERDNTIWNTNIRDDTFLNNNCDKYKPILAQSMKWHSVDNMSNIKQGPSKLMLAAISEVPSYNVDVKKQNERAGQFRNLFQTDIRENSSNIIYRYHGTQPTQMRSKNISDSTINRPMEKNKVKFSNTVTVAVVSEPPVCPETSRELADSLPLSPPHKYLSAFAPLPAAPAPPPGTSLDYVEV